MDSPDKVLLMRVRHALVFIPVQGRELVVVDPAGGYITSVTILNQRVVTSRPADEELKTYSSYWSMKGGIKTITLYNEDVFTKKYSEVFSGTLTEVANFIKTLQSTFCFESASPILSS